MVGIEISLHTPQCYIRELYPKRQGSALSSWHPVVAFTVDLLGVFECMGDDGMLPFQQARGILLSLIPSTLFSPESKKEKEQEPPVFILKYIILKIIPPPV